MAHDPLKEIAAGLAEELRSASDPLSAELRQRLIAVRAELFQRGMYDPVLVRLDSATVPKASVQEIAEQLASVAAGL